MSLRFGHPWARAEHRSIPRGSFVGTTARGGPIRVLVALLVGAGLAGFEGRADEWAVSDATVRITLRPSRRPSRPEAGYFVRIPDGGILPRPLPEATVLNTAGRQLKSAALWHHPENGLGLVFEDQRTPGPVHVYLSPARSLTTWTPESGLYPSAIQATDPDRAGMASARQVSRFGPVGSRIHFQPVTGHRQSPLCIRGDPTGRPRPASFYLLSHVVLNRSGETWFAPFPLAGEVEVRVNGQTLNPRRRNDKWGGTGQALTLNEGIHRLEILASCPGTEGFDQGEGVMWMTWRTPADTVDDLGGRRPEGVPYAGTSAWESRVFRENEILRSGACTIESLQAADGRPLAMATAHPLENYWIGDHAPVFVYDLRAVAEGAPTGTRFLWEPARGAAVESPATQWIFSGATENQVRLTVGVGTHVSQTTLPFYSYSGVRSHLSDASSRRNFQRAFLNMLRAVPDNADPTAGWTPSMWNCFMDSLSLGEGGALLTDVTLRHWERFRRQLSVDQQNRVQDLFYHFIAHYAPDTATQWLERAITGASSNERRMTLRRMLAEIYMYQQPDLNRARQLIYPLTQHPGQVLPRVRLGDIAFLQGDLNEAEQQWSAAQQRRSLRGDLTAGVRQPTPRDRVDEWKQAAVLDTRMSMTVISLINQGLLDEAHAELLRWEANFPLTKISGDYIIQEAKLYMALGNIHRARTLLAAYCRNIDASSYLAEAAELLLDCLLRDEPDDDPIRAFAEEMKRRFEFHPLSQRLQEVIDDVDRARQTR